MKTEPDALAYPIMIRVKGPLGQDGIQLHPGLTKREEFVKAAMAGLCSLPDVNLHRIGGLAVEIADATIAKLNEGADADEEDPKEDRPGPILEA